MFAQVRKLFFMIEYKVTCAHYRFSQVFALFAIRLKTVGYFLLAFKILKTLSNTCLTCLFVQRVYP